MKGKFLYEDLTKDIIASCFDVFNCLGYGYPEKVYQKSLETNLREKQMVFEREVYSKILYNGKIVGRFFLDFLVEDKVAVELKVRRTVYESDWIQLLNYLKATDHHVGLLIVFTKSGVEVKRVVN